MSFRYQTFDIYRRWHLTYQKYVSTFVHRYDERNPLIWWKEIMILHMCKIRVLFLSAPALIIFIINDLCSDFKTVQDTSIHIRRQMEYYPALITFIIDDLCFDFKTIQDTLIHIRRQMDYYPALIIFIINDLCFDFKTVQDTLIHIRR